MGRVLGIGGLLMLSACGGSSNDDDGDRDRDVNLFGMTEDRFAEQFIEIYCEAYDSCNSDPASDCPVTFIGGDAPCDFNQGAASACLDGTYVCDDSYGQGFEFVRPPEVCADVCGSPDGTTGTNQDEP